MRSHLERYEFPKPFSIQEKICMIYSCLSLCYGLAFICFIFLVFSWKAWSGLGSKLVFLSFKFVLLGMNSGSDTATFPPPLLGKKKRIRLDNFIHSVNFHGLVKTSKRNQCGLGAHSKDLPAFRVDLFVFGVWPSTIQRWTSATTAFVFLLAEC